MIESRVLEELKTEWTAEAKTEALLRFLRGRFGPLPEDLQAAVRSIQDPDRLDELITAAAECDNFASFRAALLS